VGLPSSEQERGDDKSRTSEDSVDLDLQEFYAGRISSRTQKALTWWRFVGLTKSFETWTLATQIGLKQKAKFNRFHSLVINSPRPPTVSAAILVEGEGEEVQEAPSHAEVISSWSSASSAPSSAPSSVIDGQDGHDLQAERSELLPEEQDILDHGTQGEIPGVNSHGHSWSSRMGLENRMWLQAEPSNPTSCAIPMPDLKEPTPRFSNGEISRRLSMARGNSDETLRKTGATLSSTALPTSQTSKKGATKTGATSSSTALPTSQTD
jgi:hypothetical protein